MSNRRRNRPVRTVLDQLDDRCMLSGLTPAQVAEAYGLNSISFQAGSGTVPGNGAGETIALIEAYHDPTLPSDLATFDRAFNLPAPPNLIVADQAGDVTNEGWSIEESLDVEWAHALAPAATILVVEAQSQSRQSLINAVNAARHTPGVDVISMSWGFPESANESTYNNIFTTPPGHRGITFLAASGDSGAAGGPEWPSVTPSVVAVGGTTLNVSFSGRYESETAWVDSGGGLSRYEGEPGYQRSVQVTGKRSTPDVAFDADPDTGVAVYQTFFGNHGSWEVVGGTSLGTPAWAAIIAIVDQGRALEGAGSLDGADPDAAESLFNAVVGFQRGAAPGFQDNPGGSAARTRRPGGAPRTDRCWWPIWLIAPPSFRSRRVKRTPQPLRERRLRSRRHTRPSRVSSATEGRVRLRRCKSYGRGQAKSPVGFVPQPSEPMRLTRTVTVPHKGCRRPCARCKSESRRVALFRRSNGSSPCTGHRPRLPPHLECRRLFSVNCSPLQNRRLNLIQHPWSQARPSNGLRSLGDGHSCETAVAAFAFNPC